eukprot:CAMPEP_0185552668 /NCGR_PEP_ID=MMETSP1381-20130426/34598_1 /TAXON_ID=298111 /ORGANISM="Pavlova sp., Strain CCMP459" /LENGTH=144 /DNA_ID=CAMNT_0028165671 /DNA_START=982 /DNA_END=1416 /DNA_ORIENTATION=+
MAGVKVIVSERGPTTRLMTQLWPRSANDSDVLSLSSVLMYSAWGSMFQYQLITAKILPVNHAPMRARPTSRKSILQLNHVVHAAQATAVLPYSRALSQPLQEQHLAVHCFLIPTLDLLVATTATSVDGATALTPTSDATILDRF